MENKDIIEFIKNNLNHDFEHDYEYLLKEIIHYQSLRGGEDIVPQIVNLLKTELGTEGLRRFEEHVKSNFNSRIKKYQEALTNIKTGKKKEAEDILVHLIDTFPTKKSDDDLVPMYNFQNIFESILFSKVFVDVHRIRQVQEPITGYYFHLAVLFFETKDYEECIKFLNIVLSYNPLFVEGLLLKAECQLILGYNNLFFDNIKLALKYSYKRIHFAKCYMVLGRYYTDLSDKQLAIAFLLVSKHYEVTPFVEVIFKRALALPGETVKFNQPTDLTDIFIKAKIPFGPDKIVVDALMSSIKESRNKNNKLLLKYFLTLYVTLTNDEELKKELDQLNEQGPKK